MAKNKRVKIVVRELKIWFNIPASYQIEVILPGYSESFFAFVPGSMVMGEIVKVLKYNAKHNR